MNYQKTLFVLLVAVLFSFQAAHAAEMDYNAILNNLNESDMDLEFINSLIDLESIPEEVKGIIGNEKINIYIEGIEKPLYVALSDGKIVDAGLGARDEATMRIDTDMETVGEVVEGKKSFQDALMDGTVTYGGVGFFNWLKFAIINFFMSIYNFFTGG